VHTPASSTTAESGRWIETFTRAAGESTDPFAFGSIMMRFSKATASVRKLATTMKKKKKTTTKKTTKTMSLVAQGGLEFVQIQVRVCEVRVAP